MIGLRTPLGKFTHLAVSLAAPRSLCGLAFSPGFDETFELEGIPPAEELCSSCRAVYSRRARRRARLEAA